MHFMGILYRNGYLQTWGAAARTQNIPIVGKYLYSAIRSTCGKLTGHRPSKTEWGYGGGDYGDVWCRWCNQIGRIPRSELADRFEHARHTIWENFHCDISRPTISRYRSIWSENEKPNAPVHRREAADATGS